MIYGRSNFYQTRNIHLGTEIELEDKDTLMTTCNAINQRQNIKVVNIRVLTVIFVLVELSTASLTALIIWSMTLG